MLVTLGLALPVDDKPRPSAAKLGGARFRKGGREHLDAAQITDDQLGEVAFRRCRAPWAEDLPVQRVVVVSAAVVAQCCVVRGDPREEGLQAAIGPHRHPVERCIELPYVARVVLPVVNLHGGRIDAGANASIANPRAGSVNVSGPKVVVGWGWPSGSPGAHPIQGVSTNPAPAAPVIFRNVRLSMRQRWTRLRFSKVCARQGVNRRPQAMAKHPLSRPNFKRPMDRPLLFRRLPRWVALLAGVPVLAALGLAGLAWQRQDA